MKTTLEKTKSGPSKNRRALRIEEVAEMLGISSWSVRRMIKRGDIKSSRVLSCHLIPIGEIDRILDLEDYHCLKNK